MEHRHSRSTQRNAVRTAACRCTETGHGPGCAAPGSKILDHGAHAQEIPREAIAQAGDCRTAPGRTQGPRKHTCADGSGRHMEHNKKVHAVASRNEGGKHRPGMEDAVKKLGEERHAQRLVGVPERQPAFPERLSDKAAHGREELRRVPPGKRVSCGKNDQERGKRTGQNKGDPGQLGGRSGRGSRRAVCCFSMVNTGSPDQWSPGSFSLSAGEVDSTRSVHG